MAAALATAGALVGSATTAYAQAEPFRREAPSAYNMASPKQETATCPGNYRAFASGVKVVNGNGGVVVKRMEPDAALTSVTVEAVARTGYQQPWSVVAYVMCALSTSAPELESDTTYQSSTATATCDPGDRLTGTGFRYGGPINTGYVNGVIPNNGLTQVLVHAGGAGPEPASLTAYAICKEPTQPTGPPGVRIEATTALPGTWPAMLTVSPIRSWVYGVGAATDAPGVFFDALVPNADPSVAGAQAVRAWQPAGMAAARQGKAMAVATDDDESAAVYGVVMDVFH